MAETTEKPKKSGPAWLTKAVALAESIKGILLLVGALVAGGGGMWVSSAFGDAGGADTAKMRFIADSTTRAQLAPVIAEQQAQREIMEGVFGAMMDADPKLKEGVQMRAQKNQQARRKKAEDSTLLNDLTGGSP